MNGDQRQGKGAVNIFTQLSSYMTRHVNVRYRRDGEIVEHTLRTKYWCNMGLAGKTKEGIHLFLPWNMVEQVWADPTA